MVLAMSRDIRTGFAEVPSDQFFSDQEEVEGRQSAGWLREASPGQGRLHDATPGQGEDADSDPAAFEEIQVSSGGI